jgi:hypothetical protein
LPLEARRKTTVPPAERSDQPLRAILSQLGGLGRESLLVGLIRLRFRGHLMKGVYGVGHGRSEEAAAAA